MNNLELNLQRTYQYFILIVLAVILIYLVEGVAKYKVDKFTLENNTKCWLKLPGHSYRFCVTYNVFRLTLFYINRTLFM